VALLLLSACQEESDCTTGATGSCDPLTDEMSDMSDVSAPSDMSDTSDMSEMSDVSTPSDLSEMSDVSDTAPDPWHETFGTPCDIKKRVGLFEIRLHPAPGKITGEIQVPPLVAQVLEVKAEEGPCRFMVRAKPFCDPKCPPGQQCTLEEVCGPASDATDAGTLTVTGLSEETVIPMKGDKYQKFGKDWVTSKPIFEPGSHVELTAEGGSVEAFSLQGEGSEAVEVLGDKWTFKKDLPVPLQWVPAEGPAKILIVAGFPEHMAGPPPFVYCEVEDTGSFEVPASMMAKVFAVASQAPPGSDWPPQLEVHRETVDSTQVEQGCIELVVGPFTDLSTKVEVVK
jgi:hypothetical protein